MPTVFARRVWRKSLVKLELWRENKYGCERKGLTCRFAEQIRRSYLGVPGGTIWMVLAMSGGLR